MRSHRIRAPQRWDTGGGGRTTTPRTATGQPPWAATRIFRETICVARPRPLPRRRNASPVWRRHNAQNVLGGWTDRLRVPDPVWLTGLLCLITGQIIEQNKNYSSRCDHRGTLRTARQMQPPAGALLAQRRIGTDARRWSDPGLSLEPRRYWAYEIFEELELPLDRWRLLLPYRTAFWRMLSSLVDMSPSGTIMFSSDDQFGPRATTFIKRHAIDAVRRIHDERGLQFSSLMTVIA